MRTRRHALQTLTAAAAAAAALQAQHEHHESSALVEIKKPTSPQVFTKEEFAVISQLTEHVIPKTDTPGAIDAGVPFLIDRQAKDAATAQKWRKGLGELDGLTRREQGKAFLALSSAQQIAVLKEMEGMKHWFFQLVKNSTIDAYYSTKEGRHQELKWVNNTFLTEFPGCTHPEHQVEREA